MTVCLFMASFSDGYLSENSSLVMKVASSVMGGSKYLLDHELRAQKVRVKLQYNNAIIFIYNVNAVSRSARLIKISDMLSKYNILSWVYDCIRTTTQSRRYKRVILYTGPALISLRIYQSTCRALIVICSIHCFSVKV